MKQADVVDSKCCSTCGITKPLDGFAPDKRRRDGRQARCRECVKAYQKRYRQDNREHYLQLRRLETERRKPQTQAYSATYREVNREQLRQRARERIAALSGAELEAYRASRRATSAAYRLKNPEACNERIRAWKRANPDRASEDVNRRRALKRTNGQPEKFTRTEIGDRDGWMCGICRLPVDPALHFPDHMSQSLDHVIPLADGGEHVRANTRITHWICNVRRGTGRRHTTPSAA